MLIMVSGHRLNGCKSQQNPSRLQRRPTDVTVITHCGAQASAQAGLGGLAVGSLVLWLRGRALEAPVATKVWGHFCSEAEAVCLPVTQGGASAFVIWCKH